MYELRGVERHFGILIAGVPGIQCLSCTLLAFLCLTNERPKSGSSPVVGISIMMILSIRSMDSDTWNGGLASVDMLCIIGDVESSRYCRVGELELESESYPLLHCSSVGLLWHMSLVSGTVIFAAAAEGGRSRNLVGRGIGDGGTCLNSPYSVLLKP